MLKNLFFAATICSGCATLDDSLKMGAATGALAGAAALYSTHSSTGRYATSQELNDAAIVGVGVGLISAYFIHKNIDETRSKPGPDLYFGDLPPSPFIFQKGGR